MYATTGTKSLPRGEKKNKNLEYTLLKFLCVCVKFEKTKI